MLVDLTPTGLDGKTAEDRLDGGRDHRQPQRDPVRRAAADEPSGLRIGTPALTTRGLLEDDMREIASVIATASATTSSREDALHARTQP